MSPIKQIAELYQKTGKELVDSINQLRLKYKLSLVCLIRLVKRYNHENN